MSIDLNIVNAQASQLRARANNLRDGRTALQLYQQNINDYWRGQEMAGINIAINQSVNRLMALAAELDNIATDVILAGQEVRRQEELADAMLALGRADANVVNLRITFDNATRQHNENPSPSTWDTLVLAQNRLNNEIRARNDIAATVRSLQP